MPGSRHYQQRAKLELDGVRQETGRLIVTANVPLDTSASRKLMEVRLSKEVHVMFDLPLQSQPNREDMVWSQWVDSSWTAGQPEPSSEEKFDLSYKVRLVQPPLPESHRNAARKKIDCVDFHRRGNRAQEDH